MNKRMMALLAAVSVLLSGCGFQNSTGGSADITPDGVYDEELDQELADIISGNGTYSSNEDVAEPEFTESQKAVLAEKVSFSESLELKDLLGTIMEYTMLDVVPVAEAMERWYALPDVDDTPEYGYVNDLPLDPDELYERVNRNTDEWVRSGKAFGGRKLNDEDMRFCCEQICNTMNREIPELEYEDQLDDIDSMLHELTMFEDAGGMSNAAIFDDGSFHFSRAMCENMSIITDFEGVVEQIVTHEAEHLMQKRALDDMEEMGLERAYGFMASWDDLEYDPLYCAWFIEASAERLASDFYGIDPITYETKVGYLDSFSVISVLSGYEHNSVPRLTQQQSLDRVFEMFRCSTEQEKLELLKAFYALEIIQEEPEEYMDHRADLLGRDITDDDLVDMKLEMKADLLRTMSKYFYRSLGEFVSSNDVTFEELCFLIGGWEMDVHYHFTYTDSSVPAEYSDAFLEYYSELQLAFFDGLAASMGVSSEELMDTYQAYYASIPSSMYDSIFSEQNSWNDVQIGCLSQESNNFINTLYEKQSEYKPLSVYDHMN